MEPVIYTGFSTALHLQCAPCLSLWINNGCTPENHTPQLPSLRALLSSFSTNSGRGRECTTGLLFRTLSLSLIPNPLGCGGGSGSDIPSPDGLMGCLSRPWSFPTAIYNTISIYCPFPSCLCPVFKKKFGDHPWWNLIWRRNCNQIQYDKIYCSMKAIYLWWICSWRRGLVGH